MHVGGEGSDGDDGYDNKYNGDGSNGDNCCDNDDTGDDEAVPVMAVIVVW